jgi:DNA ligase-1
MSIKDKNLIKSILDNPNLCSKWEQNRLINPVTSRKIKKDGPTYKKLMLYCNRLKVGQLSTPKKTLKPTKTKPGFNFIKGQKRAEKIKILKDRKDEMKKIIRKKQKERLEERLEKRQERQERQINTPIKLDRTRKLLIKLQNFVISMNSTNDKKKVFQKFNDLKLFIKFLFDKELEFGINSEDYKEFVKKGKFKKIKTQYKDLKKLLEELDDYKKSKALLYLHYFIQTFHEYKEIILNILDKDLKIQKGQVKEIKIDLKEKKVDMNMNMSKNILEEIEKMVYEMNKTNSTNAKKEILKKYLHLKKIIKYVYDPDIVFGVKSKNYLKFENNDKKIKKEILGPYTDLYKLLDSLSERKITGNRALLEIYHFIQQYRVHKQTILNILDKSLKIRLGKTAISDVFPKLFSTFEPALANKFKQSILDKTNEDWYVSRKLDGVRCLILINIKDKSVKCFSRTGKQFLTLGVIEKVLLKNIHEFKVSSVLDGEIIIENNGQESFKGLMEQIKKKNYTIPNPEYRVFDILTTEEFFGKVKSSIFFERYEELIRIFKGGRIANIRALKQHKFNKEKFEKMKKKSAKENWEGLMIRRNVSYKAKRSNDLLKYKEFLDDEFKVIGIVPGKMRVIIDGLEEEEEMLSSVIINLNNVNVNVGSGFTIAERRKFYKNPELIISKIITVQYFEKTEDNSLRFPVYKGIHGDKRDT